MGIMYSIMKKILLYILVFCLIVPFSFGEKEYVEDLLERASGVRAMGMGCAFTAVPASGYAIHWNIASLAFNRNPSVYFSSYEITRGMTDRSTLDGSFPVEDLMMAVSYARESLDNIPKNIAAPDDSITNFGHFDNADQGIGLGAAMKLNENLAIGLSGKISQVEIGDNVDQAFFVDFGTMYYINPQWSVGLTARNVLGVGYQMADLYYESPQRWQFGTAFMTEFLENPLLLSADLDYLREDTIFRAGAEWRPMKLLALRIGYGDELFYMGIGLQFFGARIDYAYESPRDEYLMDEATHFVSVGWEFERAPETPEIEMEAEPVEPSDAGLDKPEIIFLDE